MRPATHTTNPWSSRAAMKFTLGEAVTRGPRRGRIAAIYCTNCCGTHRHDEVYVVHWDDEGSESNYGYLPHGLAEAERN